MSFDPIAQGLAIKANNHATQYARLFYPEDYGAVGNGTTDDTAALTACFAAAMAAYTVLGSERWMAACILSKSYYVAANTITITGNNAAAAIHGFGILGNPSAAIVGSNDQVAIDIQNPVGNSWRDLLIRDINFINCGLKMGGLNNNFYKPTMWNVNIRGFATGNANAHGLTLNGVYECGLYDVRVDWVSTTNNKSAMYVTDSASEQSSSVYCYNLNLHYGYHNLWVDQYDIDIFLFGGTFLESRDSAIKSNGFMYAAGCHLEAFCSTSNNCGFELDGGFAIYSPYGYCISPWLGQYLVKTYGNGTIVGGFFNSNIAGAKIAYVHDGGSGTNITLIGAVVDSADITSFANHCLRTPGNGGLQVVTGSGGTIAGSATTRYPLTVNETDTIGGTLATNQLTLPAGKYLLEATFSGYVGAGIATIANQIYNETDASVVGSCSLISSAVTGDASGMSGSILKVVTITASKAFSVRGINSTVGAMNVGFASLKATKLVV